MIVRAGVGVLFLSSLFWCGGCSTTRPYLAASKALYRAQLGKKYGYINAKGSWVVRARFDHAQDFAEGLAVVGGDRYAIIDTMGKVRFTMEKGLIHVGRYSEGLFCTTVFGGDIAYVDSGGHQAFSLGGFMSGREFHQGLAAVERRDGCFGYVGTNGILRIPCKFNYAHAFSEDLAAVTADGKTWGFIDSTGSWAIPPQFERTARGFSEGLCLVRVTNRSDVIFIDKSGTQAFSGSFRHAETFSEGLAPVLRVGSKRYEYIDRNGRTVISGEYVAAQPFSHGLAAVTTRDGLTGFIDMLGKMAITLRFKMVWASGFDENGVCEISTDDKAGYINREGRWIYSRKK